MKARRLIAFAAALALFFCGCAAKRESPLPPVEKKPAGSALRLAVATDLHFFSRSLVREGEAFTAAYAYGDGKQINYIPELVEVFIQEMLAERPDAVLLTGDLTLNGERVGHLELAERFRVLREAGIPVLAMPGNHDIGNAFSSGYNRDKTYDVRSVTWEEFAEIYKDCGYGEAAARDPNSLSYTYPLSEDLWLILLDTNLYDRDGTRSIPQTAGSLRQETLRWLEEQLREARRQGVEVITATHHGLLDHTGRGMSGYVLDNAEDMLELCGEYGVRVNLCGHIHIQDIAGTELSGRPFYDIATSSYAVYTNQYGVLDYRPGESVSYRSREADVEGWAARTGSDDPQLLNFEEYSYQFFYDISYQRSFTNLVMAQLNQDADLELMAQTMAILNPAYFSGYAADLREEVRASDHYAMWKKHSGFAPIGYINSMLKGRELDPRSITVSLK